MQKKVSFKNGSWELRANLFLPADFGETKSYPAIVCVHPGSSVKEQTAGLYTLKLSESGFVSLAFDASYQGESGGEPQVLIQLIQHNIYSS